MWVGDMIRGILSVWNGVLEWLRAYLEMSPADWSGGQPWAAAGVIHSALMGTALGLMVLFWAASFFRYVDDIQKVGFREVFGWILRFALIYGLLSYSMDLMRVVLGVALDCNEVVMAQGGFDPVLEEPPQELMADIQSLFSTGGFLALVQQTGAFFQSLALSVVFLVLLVVVVVCGVVLIVCVYTRFFKLCIYTSLAPLPLSTLVSRSTQQTGLHFMRSWAGVCLEVCVISIAVSIFNAALGSSDPLISLEVAQDASVNARIWNESLNWILNVLIKIVTLVSVVRGSSTLISRMLGV